MKVYISFLYLHVPFVLSLLGLQDNVDAIEGFEDAWKDVDHPVHCSKDHPSWKAVDHKYQKYHYNFTNGDAIFCIPPYPFRGESKLSRKVEIFLD